MSGSSSLNNFYHNAMLIPSSDFKGELAGHCTTNVDGKCVPSEVRPQGSDKIVPVFARGNVRYAIGGWTTSPNANPLRFMRPLI